MTEQATVTVTKAGQTPKPDGTIEMPPPKEKGDFTIPEVQLSTPQAVGLTTAAVLLIVLFLLLGMYAGYYLGYKDSDKAEAKFIRAVLRK